MHTGTDHLPLIKELKLFGPILNGYICLGLFFKDLVATGSLSLGNNIQIECLWFVFSPLVECELDRLTEEWNAHILSSRKLQTTFISSQRV